MLGFFNSERVFLDGWIEVKGKRRKFLDALDNLVDWQPIQKELNKLYANKGRPSHPPLAAFKMLLIQHFYNLSDPGCEEAVADSLAFRSFCGLGFGDKIPDETTLVRFRKRLIKHNLHERLLGLVNAALDHHGLGVRRATIIDASIVEAAVSGPKKEESPKDPEASYTVKNNEVRYGYKAHVSSEATTGLIQKAVLTTAKVHDSQVFEVLDDGETPIAADKAYYSKAREERLGTRSYLMKKGVRGRALCELELAYNKAVSRVRARIEKIFGYWKRTLGYRQVRYRGLSPGRLELELKSICWNLRRAVTLVG